MSSFEFPALHIILVNTLYNKPILSFFFFIKRNIFVQNSIFRYNSAKIMAFLSFWDWPIFNCKIRDFFFKTTKLKCFGYI